MEEKRLTELEALCAAGVAAPWNDNLCTQAANALPEALAEVRRLRADDLVSIIARIPDSSDGQWAREVLLREFRDEFGDVQADALVAGIGDR